MLKQLAMHALGLSPQAASVAALQLVITPGENGTFASPVVQIPLTYPQRAPNSSVQLPMQARRAASSLFLYLLSYDFRMSSPRC